MTTTITDPGCRVILDCCDRLLTTATELGDEPIVEHLTVELAELEKLAAAVEAEEIVLIARDRVHKEAAEAAKVARARHNVASTDPDTALELWRQREITEQAARATAREYSDTSQTAAMRRAAFEARWRRRTSDHLEEARSRAGRLRSMVLRDHRHQGVVVSDVERPEVFRWWPLAEAEALDGLTGDPRAELLGFFAERRALHHVAVETRRRQITGSQSQLAASLGELDRLGGARP